MKLIAKTVLTILAITGLMLAGSESQTFAGQLGANVTGLVLFGASMFGISEISRGDTK